MVGRRQGRAGMGSKAGRKRRHFLRPQAPEEASVQLSQLYKYEWPTTLTDKQREEESAPISKRLSVTRTASQHALHLWDITEQDPNSHPGLFSQRTAEAW